MYAKALHPVAQRAESYPQYLGRRRTVKTGSTQSLKNCLPLEPAKIILQGPFCIRPRRFGRGRNIGKLQIIDYKDTHLLRTYISERGKIRARRVTGNCVQHQRDIAIAVKNAREVALLPFTSTSR